MKVRFDSLNRFETPKLYVCNPGCEYRDGLMTNVVGCLSDTTDEELVLNFNAVSELNFRAYRIRRDDSNDNAYSFAMYNALKNRRLIFMEDIGFFVITSVSDGYENGYQYKDIRAESCETEIAQKTLTYIEDGTYLFTNLIEKIVATLPAWTVGYIDAEVADKHRTFTDISTELNTLAFLQDNIQDAYECICLFDIINRRINIYDQNSYVKETNIHITKEDVINSIDISETSDDLYTAISVSGDNNLTIASVNPLGTNVIYNFDYYLDWMSPTLKDKVESWIDLMDTRRDEYYGINLEYYNSLTTRFDLQSDLAQYETQITMYRRCRENVVANGDTSDVAEYSEAAVESGGINISIGKEIDETIAELDNLIAIAQNRYDSTQEALNEVNHKIESLMTSIQEIQAEVSINNYFTQSEYNELYNYIYEGAYNDEYITITDSMTYSEKFEQMKTLYDRAVTQLERISQPTQEFSIDVENFLFAKEFESVSDQLETGCLINAELEDGDIASLFLSTITVNYDDRSLCLRFGNRYKRFDPKSLFDNVLGNIKKSTNTLDYIKDLVYPIKAGEFDSMQEALAVSKTLTMNSAISSSNEEVIIDGSGYTGRKILESGEYDPRQVKLTGRSLVFTDDAWESCKVALGELVLGNGETTYGINADSIIGQMIIGNNLSIIDSNGTPIFEVVDNKIEAVITDYGNSLTKIQQTADAINIRVEALENSEGVTSVTTTTGYTFNQDGLTIHKSGEEITNLLDNTGMYVSRGDDNILIANNSGVEAINLTAHQYLVVGLYSRFENYSTSEDSARTGCFFIGNTAAVTDE